jgi:hypothetical protein
MSKNIDIHDLRVHVVKHVRACERALVKAQLKNAYDKLKLDERHYNNHLPYQAPADVFAIICEQLNVDINDIV